MASRLGPLPIWIGGSPGGAWGGGGYALPVCKYTILCGLFFLEEEEDKKKKKGLAGHLFFVLKSSLKNN